MRPVHPSAFLGLVVLFLSLPHASPLCGAEPEELWRWEGEVQAPDAMGPCSTPLVVSLTDDDGDGRIDERDVPDVLFIHRGELSGIGLTALDGATGAEHFSVRDETLLTGTLAAGDIDGDGIPEILAQSIDGLTVYEHDGTLAQVVPPRPRTRVPVSIADMDHDGSPEIVAGTRVWNADGTLRWEVEPHEGLCTGLRYSLVADIDPDSDGLELLDGPNLYDADGALLWSTPGLPAGYTALADFTANGRPEIILAAAEALYLLDAEGRVLGSPHLPSAPGTCYVQPIAADIDADGHPEAVVARNRVVEALHWVGDRFEILWSLEVHDESGSAGLAAFDVDGDGADDVFYRDENRWYLLDGPTGEIIYDPRFPSGTEFEKPVVADIDGDCDAELLVSGCFRSTGGLDIPLNAVVAYDLGSEPARPVWNQHLYHVDNVEPDGSIPVRERPSWRSHNSWGAQVAPEGITSCSDLPPVCDAGGPYTVTCEDACSGGFGGFLTMLDGSGSSDPEGEPLRYAWGISCGPLGFPGPSEAKSEICLPIPGDSCARPCIARLTVTDPSGQSASCVAQVFLEDGTPPELNPPPDRRVECGAPTDPDVTGEATASDDCPSSPELTHHDVIVPGGCPGDFDILRTWTAEDLCGNTATAVQTIEVRDTTPPTLDPAPFSTRTLWPPSHEMVCFPRADFSVEVSDSCSEPVRWHLSGCSSSQPVDGLGDGRTSPDCLVAPSEESVCVRSERQGTDPAGRTYTVEAVAVDACGNASAPRPVGSFDVPHDRR